MPCRRKYGFKLTPWVGWVGNSLRFRTLCGFLRPPGPPGELTGMCLGHGGGYKGKPDTMSGHTLTPLLTDMPVSLAAEPPEG